LRLADDPLLDAGSLIDSGRVAALGRDSDDDAGATEVVNGPDRG